MGFNKKIYTCETCGLTIIGEDKSDLKCKKIECNISDSEKEKIKNPTLVVPKIDIRVNGC